MVKLRGRDRAGTTGHYFDAPNADLNVPCSGVLRVAVLIIGALGFASGSFGVASGHPIIPKSCRNCAVLSAAPISSILTVPCSVAFCRTNAPPPYRIVESLYKSPSDTRPSSLINWPMLALCCETLYGNFGTIGVHAFPPGVSSARSWAKADCRKVEVWFPSADMQRAPSTNDPNAKVTLRITIPPSGKTGDCTVWKYHQGSKPKRAGGELYALIRGNADQPAHSN